MFKKNKKLTIIPLKINSLKSVYSRLLNESYEEEYDESNLNLYKDFNSSPISFDYLESMSEIMYGDDFDLTGMKLFMIKEEESSYIHVCAIDKNNDIKNNLSNAKFLYVIDTDYINNHATQIDNVISAGIKKIKQTQNKKTKQPTIIKNTVIRSFTKILKRNAIRYNLSNDSIVFTGLLEKIKNDSNCKEEFHKNLDEAFDNLLSTSFNNINCVIRAGDFVDKQFIAQNKDVNFDISYKHSAEDTRYGGYGNLTIPENAFVNICDALIMSISAEGDIQVSSDNKNQVIHAILSSYSDAGHDSFLKFSQLADRSEIRKSPDDIDDAIRILNNDDDFTKELSRLPNKGGTQGQTKGRGEASVHMLLNTTNVCSSIEPDAIIETLSGQELRCSIKSMQSGSAQTGTTMYEKLESSFNDLKRALKLESFGGTISYKDLIVLLVKLHMEKNSITDVKQGIKDFYIKSDHITSSSPQADIREAINKSINKITSIDDINADDITRAYIAFKNHVVREHTPDYVLVHNVNGKFDYLDVTGDNNDVSQRVIISGIKASRVSFKLVPSAGYRDFDFRQNNNKIDNNTGGSYFEKAISAIIKTLNEKEESVDIDDDSMQKDEDDLDSNNDDVDEYQDQQIQNTLSQNSDLQDAESQNSSFRRKGVMLKEVFDYLYLGEKKKNKINEGGLGGHMNHPYEVLDSSPNEMIQQVRKYSVPQNIVEKVDGQNLFFTVDKDGVLLFARNKEDMTHEQLVEKFRGHGAELPFVEGGNAIKSGVSQWLNNGGMYEIEEIFHPALGVRSFINFEIMHPEKPNQIQYDEKYIVIHSIVDFKEGREQVRSSSSDKRIQQLIQKIKSGVNSSGFQIASNKNVSLNTLKDVQILDYIARIRKVAKEIGIGENETFSEGIMNIIYNELLDNGIDMSKDALEKLKSFVVGDGKSEDGVKVKSRDFTKSLSKEDLTKLRSIGLTNSDAVLKKLSGILSPFKEIFVDLGIDLLKGVKSSYMSEEYHDINIRNLRNKLTIAVEDLENYLDTVPEENWSKTAKRLIPHLAKIKSVGIENIVSSSVEGGVYNNRDNLMKITGGFAPMNQIIGAAYRDKEGIFNNFKQEFLKKESVTYKKRNSLKEAFNLIF